MPPLITVQLLPQPDRVIHSIGHGIRRPNRLPPGLPPILKRAEAHHPRQLRGVKTIPNAAAQALGHQQIAFAVDER